MFITPYNTEVLEETARKSHCIIKTKRKDPLRGLKDYPLGARNTHIKFTICVSNCQKCAKGRPVSPVMSGAVVSKLQGSAALWILIFQTFSLMGMFPTTGPIHGQVHPKCTDVFVPSSFIESWANLCGLRTAGYP